MQNFKTMQTSNMYSYVNYAKYWNVVKLHSYIIIKTQLAANWLRTNLLQYALLLHKVHLHL